MIIIKISTIPAVYLTDLSRIIYMYVYIYFGEALLYWLNDWNLVYDIRVRISVDRRNIRKYSIIIHPI